MKKQITILFLLCSVLLSAQKKPVDYVDCFIGTSNSRWMLGPYAQVPFGMVQLGPDNQGDKWMGGYEYAINSVSGFSHLHAWTMGGLMMMPTTADLALTNPGPDSPYKGANAGYHSRILKETEIAKPGYYAVDLYDHKVKVEITTTTHCGFQKYTFPTSKESRILIDLLFPTEWDYGFKVRDAKISKVSDTEIEGYADCISGNWSSFNDYKLHFVIRFSRPFAKFHGIKEGNQVPDISSIEGAGDVGAYVVYQTEEGDDVMVQTALSLVDMDGARRNLSAEMDPFNWNFDQCVAQASTVWNDLLGRIVVEGDNEKDKTKFYTNLYRSYCGKQTWSDVDGRYRDACENVRQLEPGQAVYGGDAFWNSYWNLNGLWSIITPKIIDNFVTTQLEMFEHTGWTSKGPAGIEYSDIMEGSHEIALMVAAYQKGIRKDGDAIYKAIHKMGTTPGQSFECGGGVGQHDLEYYNKFGYMPREIGVVSKTLDYAYDDFCIAQLAKRLGKKKDASFFNDRSQNYKNVFHPEYKYVVMKDSLGNWDPNFDKFSNKGFIEGNSWQYSWYVPHDTKGLIKTLGGKSAASERLIDGFEKSRAHNFAAHVFDRTLGQSAEFYINQGNEVNMSSPFIFNYLKQPWLCQQYTREILERFYGATPYHGWEGDEDEGQLGSWFVMTALGLFEMDGGVTANSFVEITSPLFNKTTIKLDNSYYKGVEFSIEAKNNAKNNVYIQRATLNGVELKEPRIPFKAIVNGGALVLEMGDTPNRDLWRK
jgi:predicted alpha-1,2-mannosidase